MNNLSEKLITVATFYQFTTLSPLVELRDQLHQLGKKLSLRGTILLAKEGINSTLAGDEQQIDELHRVLVNELGFKHLSWKQTTGTSFPFKRWKVRIKREIVTLGVEGLNPETSTGKLVNPEHWNALITDPDVVVIDTRNHYEVAIGTFAGAKDPHTQRFSQFVDYVERELAQDKKRKIAMFCTGGIRCEKASSFLLSQGFEQVYQLQGGILAYLAQIPPVQSLWQGECVVFDERVAVDHRQRNGRHQWCAYCGAPVRIEEGTHCNSCPPRNIPLSSETTALANSIL